MRLGVKLLRTIGFLLPEAAFLVTTASGMTGCAPWPAALGTEVLYAEVARKLGCAEATPVGFIAVSY